MDRSTSPEHEELSWWEQHMGRLTEERMSPLSALACEPSPQYELSAAPLHQTPWDRFVELLAHDEETARVFHAGDRDPQRALEAVRRSFAPALLQIAAERPSVVLRPSEVQQAVEGRTIDLSDLTPLQEMVLEVYRVHTRYGFPGTEPGSVKHDVGTCHKCALLDRDRVAFEAVLPWAGIRHLIPTGHRDRVRYDAVLPSGRVFTEDVEPPFGERIRMMTDGRAILVWTGKRWYWEGDGDGSMQTQEAWPPDEPGPYLELSVPFFDQSKRANQGAVE